MSRNRAVGTMAERLIAQYLNSWCEKDTTRDWEGMGYPFDRHSGKGSRDEGDVFGPYTMIEAKNHKNTVVGSLLANAEWKAENARRPIWALCYKVAGYGAKNVGLWECAMTVAAFNNITESGWSLQDGTRFQYDLVSPTERIVGICGRGRPMQFSINDHREWGLGGAAQDLREQLWRDRTDDDTIPVLVSPRRGAGGHMMDFERWTVTFKLHGMGRMLEALGVLPGATVDTQEEHQ